MRHLAGLAAIFTAVVGSSQPARAELPAQGSLSELLKRQTEAFSAANQSGDRAVLARYLDPDVVFTNETGESATRDELLADASPPAGSPPRTVIEDWTLRPQGDVATATFTDIVTRNLFGHVVEARFRSTETWARRVDGWKMIASDTAYVPHDPPPIRLGTAELDEYVGLYQLTPGMRVQITRAGDGLVSSTNGGRATPLAFEVRDVAFSAGGGNGRRLFLRSTSGRVQGYLSSRDGTSLRFDRVS